MYSRLLTATVLFLIAFTLIYCNRGGEPDPRLAELSAHDAFFETLRSLCGQQLHGEGTYPDDPDHELIDVDLIMIIESCDDNEIRIPVHAGADRSRTWVITRSDEGLHLRHSHRYEDGTPHELTNYGGWATQDGDSYRQFFAADEVTAEMLPEASTNVWMMEVDLENNRFIYYLERHEEPRFRAEFDLP